MPRMFLIDGSNHAFRVHFGLPPMHNSSGFPTRALYGFTTLLAKLIRTWEPEYVVVSFDRGTTFRHELFPEYKGHRPDMPEDLRQQWPLLPDLVEAFGFKCIMVPNYEADDVLGTLAKRFASPDLQIYLVTGDQDFWQLVDENIRILDLMKDEELGPKEVEERLGLPPNRMIDVLGLSGDASDNIPGVAGIGEKTAVKYLQKYATLEGVLAAADEIGGKRGATLKESAEIALLSRTLATIAIDVPMDISLPDLAIQEVNEELLRTKFDEWDFGKVARKLLPERRVMTSDHYQWVKTKPELEKLLKQLMETKRFALTVQPMGVGMCWSLVDAAWIEFSSELGAGDVWREFGELMANAAIGKVVYDAKVTRQALQKLDVTWKGEIGDVLLLDYVLAAHERSHSLEELAQRHLGHTLMAAVGGSLPFARPADEAARMGAEVAHVIWLLEERLVKRLEAGTRRIYSEIELPLTQVLADMESVGIRVAVEQLDGIRVDIDARLVQAEQKCHQVKGRVFNVNSRHEIAEALFADGEFTPTKKVKDGWSTDASVLEKLADGTNLPSMILEYRQLQKLKGTYLDKLPTYIAADGRIHSHFNQAVAATGRLSSEEPNLQNIPIRTFEGRRIRDCFVPEPGFKFLSADYSQIELRILAHLTEESALIQSFQRGEDIHRRTASEVFGVSIQQVSSAHRNMAKAINFGLMYGMSSFRLAGDLNISRQEAMRYMEDYFGRMPKVGGWIEQAKQEAKKQGYVDTLFGRRRIIPAIYSANFQERSAAEREAVNTKVQGTAADIIKMAMLKVWQRLKQEQVRARILLQVHDELLLEVPDEEMTRVRGFVKEEMERAAMLSVPLEVNTAVGSNWNEAHG